MVTQVCLGTLKLFECDFGHQNLYLTIYKLKSFLIVNQCFYLMYLLFQIDPVIILQMIPLTLFAL